MNNCNCQKNIKKPIGDRLPINTVDTTAAEKPTGDGLLITIVATTTTGIFFDLRTLGIGQQGALLTFTSLVWLMSLLLWKR